MGTLFNPFRNGFTFFFTFYKWIPEQQQFPSLIEFPLHLSQISEILRHLYKKKPTPNISLTGLRTPANSISSKLNGDGPKQSKVNSTILPDSSLIGFRHNYHPTGLQRVNGAIAEYDNLRGKTWVYWLDSETARNHHHHFGCVKNFSRDQAYYK